MSESMLEIIFYQDETIDLGGVMENLDQKWIDRGGPNCVVEAHKSPARLGLVNMKVHCK